MEIFSEALELPSVEERAAYLDRVCGSDRSLRARVEGLLRAHDEDDDFLENPGSAPTVDVAPGGRPTSEGPGTVIGPYKLMEQIGEGGMGVVFVAEQNQPVRRRVALKVIKPGMDSRQVVARFEAERQALAMMDHPNIAKVHDGGTTASGRPYFVMELVRGIPITEYCDRERLSVPERLELFVLVCRAVQHAHQKGIIHRDLKPSNTLVTIIDGAAVPKVIDFGVAKATGPSLTDRTVYTAFHQFVGTPLYMSPEQADLSGMDIDTRSDIYSLGVLLYELMTATTPFDQETFRTAAFDELRRIIRESEPPKPSTRLSSLGTTRATVSANRKADVRQLDRTVRGELDWIVMKALEKDRRRRYETANDFASDVMRYLTDQPVQACPPSAGYRLRKFVRRNKGPAAAGLALTALLVLGTVGTSMGLVWALQAERKARTAEKLARDRLVEITKEKERATAVEGQAKEEADIATAVKDFLQNDLLAEAEPEKNSRSKKVTVAELLGRAAARIADKFAQQPRIEAEIRHTIGVAYAALGDFAAAQPHLERAREIGRRVLGEVHPSTLEFTNDLGLLYVDQGKLAQAEPLLVQALEACRQVLGNQHPDTLTCMSNLGLLYSGQGKSAQAEPLLVQALQAKRRVLGEEDVRTLVGTELLAGLYQDKGRFAEAEPLLLKALELHRVQGEENRATIYAMNNLAGLYSSQGETTKAEPLFARTLEIGQRILGRTHPETRRVARNLADAYRCNMKFERSIPLLEDMLKWTRANQGPDHPDTLGSMSDLGVNYRDAGRLSEGTALLEEARAKALKQPGFPVDDLAQISIRLGLSYEQGGQFVKAEPLYRETLETTRKRQNVASIRSNELQYCLAHNLLSQQRYAEAESLLRECLKFGEKHQTNDWRTFSTKSLLGCSVLGQKKYAEAEPLLLAGYEGMKQREGKLEPIYRFRLTEAIELMVQFCEATVKKEEAAQWRAKLLEANSAKPAEAKNN
jgi:non-specific serine/threonine protein kinase/serine/threonine-protein kinase